MPATRWLCSSHEDAPWPHEMHQQQQRRNAHLAGNSKRESLQTQKCFSNFDFRTHSTLSTLSTHTVYCIHPKNRNDLLQFTVLLFRVALVWYSVYSSVCVCISRHWIFQCIPNGRECCYQCALSNGTQTAVNATHHLALFAATIPGGCSPASRGYQAKSSHR